MFDNELFNVDGSIRFERVEASGFAIGGGTEFLIAPDPSNPALLIPAMTANGVSEQLNYARSYTSWTVGGHS